MLEIRKLSFWLSAVLLILTASYFFIFSKVMEDDYPGYCNEALLKYYDFQNQFKSQNGVYNVSKEASDFRSINSQMLEVDSALSLRHCRDCHLKKESYKVLCIMSLSKVNKYFFYTIDSNNQTSFLGRFEKKEL